MFSYQWLNIIAYRRHNYFLISQAFFLQEFMPTPQQPCANVQNGILFLSKAMNSKDICSWAQGPHWCNYNAMSASHCLRWWISYLDTLSCWSQWYFFLGSKLEWHRTVPIQSTVMCFYSLLHRSHYKAISIVHPASTLSWTGAKQTYRLLQCNIFKRIKTWTANPLNKTETGACN